MAKKFTSIYDFLEQTKDMTPAEAGSQFYGLSQEEIKEILSQKKEVPKAGEENEKSREKESNEKFTSILPSAVSKQEKDALDYFTTNNEVIKHLQIIKDIQKLRDKRMITYKDTGNGTYEVQFNLPGNKLKRYMPPDTSIADSKSTYTLWDGTNQTNQETTKGKLRSDEEKKYLKEKQTKEGKSLISKENFLKLGESLCPNGSDQEKILAIMLATGFYGWMRLSDKDSSSQLAVLCSRKSDLRKFHKLHSDHNDCSIIYTSTL